MLKASSVMIGPVFLALRGFRSSNRQRYVKRIYFVHASSFQKTEKYCKIVETGDRIPVKCRKGEPPLVFYLFGGATPTSSQVTLQLLARLERQRGCKHFLPNKQPADSALASLLPSPPSLPLPPRGGTGRSSRLCGRQLQPQGCVISVHHSQQRGSLSSGGTQKHSRLG